MCRSTVSIGWKGEIYDCDFNQMLGMQLRNGKALSLWDVTPDYLEGRFITMAHELAHLFCGHLGFFNGICQDRRGKSCAVDDIEATAYLVATRLGLKSSSERYLSTYLRGETRPTFSMDAVLVAAGKKWALKSRGIPGRLGCLETSGDRAGRAHPAGVSLQREGAHRARPSGGH